MDDIGFTNWGQQSIADAIAKADGRKVPLVVEIKRGNRAVRRRRFIAWIFGRNKQDALPQFADLRTGQMLRKWLRSAP